jgi:hypothetical protein
MEAVDLCPAIGIGNGDASALQLADHHFRSGLRYACGRTKIFLKYLFDHIGHALTAGVVQQGLTLALRAGNDHDIPAFALQVIDGCGFIAAVEKMYIFPYDPALSVVVRAVSGEVSGIF